ncbi:copper resistance CopC family protein [Brachybacterium squillarum]|uniref:copper resistance CopC family protein n=1 Tax=Brachybacterium squillarum TaxID=661979 RepID=UPI000262B1F1|nr:copper resistance CopC family protein [Brachybacterium squillarum]
MITHAPGRLRALPASLLALLAALLVAAVMIPAPALAHDTLVSADPEDGASFETSPEEVTLTYSADILDVGPVVQIADAEGETVAELTPEVDGPEVTAAIEDSLPAGDYAVQWRVVSSDGHPIEGTQTFTVEQDPATEETTEAAEPTASASAEASPAEGADSGDSGSPVLLIAIIGVAVLVVALGAVLALRRRD